MCVHALYVYLLNIYGTCVLEYMYGCVQASTVYVLYMLLLLCITQLYVMIYLLLTGSRLHVC